MRLNGVWVWVLLLWSISGISQQHTSAKKYVLDLSQFHGSVLLHNTDISHLITAHPGGVILGINQKRFGQEAWEREYGYPDTGFTLVYQNMNSATLGENFSIYAHYNFYFFKRNLQLRIGQGLAYNTNPYDRDRNFRNNAYGSHLLASTLAMVNYHKENLIGRLGLKGGISLIHYSNANVRAPNTSTNTMALNVGLTYDLQGRKDMQFIDNERQNTTEPIRYNLALRGGVNESDVIGSGQYGFWIVSAYADKRLGRKSAVQLGADVFFSRFLKELIHFQSVAFPENNVSRDTDWKRTGIFVGHELFINKLSVIAQLGYYVYYPFDFEGRVYNRIGLKRYFGDKVFGAITLKSHAAAAEAVEFGVGIRF
ncbi:MAG: acyloxyacyl hydrolase [Flavobacteriaceae bacterium]